MQPDRGVAAEVVVVPHEADEAAVRWFAQISRMYATPSFSSAIIRSRSPNQPPEDAPDRKDVPIDAAVLGVTLKSGMAHYLVRAKPKMGLHDELRDRLHRHALVNLRPFGRALTHSLTEARIERDGTAIWEEEDYCSPPLAEERAAVLDQYFDRITVERVDPGAGSKRIERLPKLAKRAGAK